MAAPLNCFFCLPSLGKVEVRFSPVSLLFLFLIFSGGLGIPPTLPMPRCPGDAHTSADPVLDPRH